MAISIPNLDVYFIDFNQPQKHKKSIIKIVGGTAIGGPIGGIIASIKDLKKEIPQFKRLIDENRFNIISSEEELAKYINANDNSWVINDKSLKKRQYYIRHPKKSKENLLIEAKDFYRYIEEEQKDELVEFILAHCPAKVIKIDKTEGVNISVGASGNVKGADLKAGVRGANVKGNYYMKKAKLFRRLKRETPRDKYYWLDKSIMRSISTMKKGETFIDKLEIDFTCGLDVSEAQILDLDMKMHKKFTYTIYVKC